MPKSTNKPRNPDDDPTVLAARINRSGTIRNGFIAAAAAVLVSILGLTNRFCDQQPKPEPDLEPCRGGEKIGHEQAGFLATGQTQFATALNPCGDYQRTAT
jgi:hypothetical protein